MATPRPSLVKLAPEPVDERKAALVEQIAAACVPAYSTAADNYLQSRSIRPPYPADLMFHSALKTCNASGLPMISGGMVALVRKRPGGPIIGLHRTFLTRDGRKNADARSVKAMLGPCKGGALWPDEFGDVLAMAEGIETALSYQMAFSIPTASALSAASYEAIGLPAPVTLLVIAADRDAHGVGLAAAKQAARRLYRPGMLIKVQLPVGHKDFNDALCRAESQ